MTKKQIALHQEIYRQRYNEGFSAGLIEGKKQAMKDVNLEKIQAINKLVSNFGQTLDVLNSLMQPIR